MVATPKDFTIVLTDVGGNKVVQQESFSNTDVANAYATSYSTGSLTYIIAKQDCMLSDISHESGIADTTQLQLFVNGEDKNVRFIVASVLTSINNRLPFPIGVIPKGAMIQFKELA